MSDATPPLPTHELGSLSVIWIGLHRKLEIWEKKDPLIPIGGDFNVIQEDIDCHKLLRRDLFGV